MKNKAALPIGVIILVIVVIVAGFGIYWFYTHKAVDCSDVVDDGALGNSLHRWHIEDIPVPKVQFTINDQWIFTYLKNDGSGAHHSYSSFVGLDDLEAKLDTVTDISSDDRARLNHIFHCIHANWGY